MRVFQTRVRNWVVVTFGLQTADDVEDRCHVFLEEAIELVQSLGCSRENASAVLDYVYSRPVGDPHQEVGGTMVTLAALCSAAGLDAADCGDVELSRIWRNLDNIRAKAKAKPILPITNQRGE